ncbi:MULTISPECIES: RagB/SusD family nutrient uptake outer membrane protein [Mucilaginibacter]|uniref:RagB/SusD family nutrient uptake outer membrane protein n=1 Tax=Mucilaginibacter TaxID=423349 RepID=UPI0008716956|nr:MULTISPECIES: RagB/SusD family nutrient uptake outer membrane protein [Mucilaginibacter]GGB24291.1 glycan metabolism protein RagB [Mucilaginibacter rubeus]SCW70710.1 Starch-binding associating with outer membrane [Mucilaginibacter sp. NFR10]
MKAKKLISIALLSTLSLGACKKSYLDKPINGALEPQFLETESGANELLVGAYAVLDGQQGGDAAVGGGGAWEASPDNWVYGGVVGGDASKGSIAGDQQPIEPMMKYNADASNGFFDSKWRADYEGVSRTNNTIKITNKVTSISASNKTNILAQARFLRAHYYFDLKKMFNNVPYLDETTTDINQPNNTDIWPKIEADFKFAYDNLPNTQTEVGRANKWAAGAYLGKTYLYEHKYAEAKVVFDAVIAQGVTSDGKKYALNAKFNDNFRTATNNSAESVFAVQAAANTDPNGPSQANNGDMLNFPYGNSSPFSCCGFYQPSIDLVNHFRTNSTTGLPYLDDYNSHAIKTDMGLASADDYTPDAGTIDPRLDWTAGRRGIPYLDWGLHPGADWIRDQQYGGPYSPIKNVYGQAEQDVNGDNTSWAPGSGINYNIIRYADVLLMAAEVEAQVGSLDKAESYVNMVRNRAANPEGFVHKYKDNDDPTAGFTTQAAANYKVSPYPGGAFANKDFALKAIYFERKIELAMEGHRFFDLVRWGIADTELNAYIAYQSTLTNDVKGGKFIKGKSEYFPIPLVEIDLSAKGGTPQLKQNPGYH